MCNENYKWWAPNKPCDLPHDSLFGPWRTSCPFSMAIPLFLSQPIDKLLGQHLRIKVHRVPNLTRFEAACVLRYHRKMCPLPVCWMSLHSAFFLFRRGQGTCGGTQSSRRKEGLFPRDQRHNIAWNPWPARRGQSRHTNTHSSSAEGISNTYAGKCFSVGKICL